MKRDNKRAFTLIELIVVIVVLGILVLLAAPKLLGYKESAKKAQITNDIRAYENAIEVELINNERFIDGWQSADSSELGELRGSLFDRKGLVEDDEVFNGVYSIIQDDLVNSKLNGTFYLGEGGKVYYQESTTNAIDNEREQETPSDVDLGMENDFEWEAAEGEVDEALAEEAGIYLGPDGKYGYFKYVGEGKEIIEIPHIIQGIEMTNYYGMFNEVENIEKVISTNENVTSMIYMFLYAEIDELDLSELNTSNVTNMDGMFAGTQVTELNLSDLNTSNVTDIGGMFMRSSIETLDLSDNDISNVAIMSGMFSFTTSESLVLIGFDTSNVTDMSSMFSHSHFKSLDLSSFDISNVTNMNSMFYDAQTTSGFAKTQEDADQFNGSSGKPVGLTFTVK